MVVMDGEISSLGVMDGEMSSLVVMDGEISSLVGEIISPSLIIVSDGDAEAAGGGRGGPVLGARSRVSSVHAASGGDDQKGREGR